jgi:hypothetical protein
MITTPPIESNPINIVPRRMVTTSFDIENLQPIQYNVLSLDNYSFDDKIRTTVKRKTKKRKKTHHRKLHKK